MSQILHVPTLPLRYPRGPGDCPGPHLSPLLASGRGLEQLSYKISSSQAFCDFLHTNAPTAGGGRCHTEHGSWFLPTEGPLCLKPQLLPRALTVVASTSAQQLLCPCSLLSWEFPNGHQT